MSVLKIFFINIGKCLTWFFCIVLFYGKSCRYISNPTKKNKLKKCLKLSLLEIWVNKSEISENKCTYFKVFERPCRHDIMHLLMPLECPYGIKTENMLLQKKKCKFIVPGIHKWVH